MHIGCFSAARHRKLLLPKVWTKLSLQSLPSERLKPNSMAISGPYLSIANRKSYGNNAQFVYSSLPAIAIFDLCRPQAAHTHRGGVAGGRTENRARDSGTNSIEIQLAYKWKPIWGGRAIDRLAIQYAPDILWRYSEGAWQGRLTMSSQLVLLLGWKWLPSRIAGMPEWHWIDWLPDYALTQRMIIPRGLKFGQFW